MKHTKTFITIIVGIVVAGSVGSIAGYIERGQQISVLQSEITELRNNAKVNKAQWRKMGGIQEDVCETKQEIAHIKGIIEGEKLSMQKLTFLSEFVHSKPITK
jgi:hypothetical protein